MKRIAFFGIKTFPSQGATDRVAENIILQLKDRYIITVYCFKDPAAETNIPGVNVRQFRRWAPGALGSLIYFFFSAFDLLFFNSVDLVHIHKTESALFAPFFKLKYKVVSTSHEAQYKSDKWNAFAKLFFHFVEGIYIKHSHICTCISNPLSDFYSKKYGKQVYFIPNGINPTDQDQFDYHGMNKFIPSGANPNEPFLLFAARRLMRIKGCHHMLKALKEIGYQGQVFITGDLHTTADYQAELDELSKGLRVYYLGFVNPLPTLLALISKSELFIFPSETEGMSIMLLEVASVGRPIIASDIPENKQVFSDDEVLYFHTKNHMDLAEKIAFALKNPDKMKKFGLSCQDKVYSNYQWSKVAIEYARVYDELLDR